MHQTWFQSPAITRQIRQGACPQGTCVPVKTAVNRRMHRSPHVHTQLHTHVCALVHTGTHVHMWQRHAGTYRHACACNRARGHMCACTCAYRHTRVHIGMLCGYAHIGVRATVCAGTHVHTHACAGTHGCRWACYATAHVQAHMCIRQCTWAHVHTIGACERRYVYTIPHGNTCIRAHAHVCTHLHSQIHVQVYAHTYSHVCAHVTHMCTCIHAISRGVGPLKPIIGEDSGTTTSSK